MPKSVPLLTPDRCLRLTELSDVEFEQFLLHFLNTHPELTINRNGKAVTRRVIGATTYARGGRRQKGIDLRIEVEGGEVWAMQAKRVKSWNRSQTIKAVEDAREFGAAHHLLVLACNPPGDVHDEIARHSRWTLWNLDRICAEVRLRTPPEQLARVLFFLAPDELRRFSPFATAALIGADRFFAARLGSDKPFRHDWNLVGREPEMQAMETFLDDEQARGFILWSKGGEGKSRLLLEFARRAETREHRVPVLFLNPASHESLDFALLRDEPKFVVVVDDAHRLDPRHRELVQLAAQDARVKLIFATRPQGFEPLLQELMSAGLREKCRDLPLPPLRKAEVRQLAEQALGAERAAHAEALVALTADCPFLTVIAGDLLARDQLRWGKWASHADFRRMVFAAFEDESLRDLDPAQRQIAWRVLRVIALVAPVAAGTALHDSLARCLGIPALDAEETLHRLQRIELLTGGDAALRIVPDLFADFLVYNTCFDPAQRKVSLADAVRAAFPDAASAILRNVAETAWIAATDGLDTETFLQPLVEAEFARFKNSSFYERAVFLDHWAQFGLFLPAQTVALAGLALSVGETAPRARHPAELFRVPKELDNREYVLEHLPKILQPIALHHDAQRHRALDLLWDTGWLIPPAWTLRLGEHGHPWGTIGAILKIRARTLNVNLDALRWLNTKLHAPGGLDLVAENRGMLRAMLAGCFARFVEFTEREGMKVGWWNRPVSRTNTAQVRQAALALLRHVIETGSWRAALAALDVAENAAHGIPKSQRWVESADAFRTEWRADRLAALALFALAIDRHPEPALRYAVRSFLLRDLAREEDVEFRQACLDLLKRIPTDFRLRLARGLISLGFSETDEDEMPNGRDVTPQMRREKWFMVRARIFDEFLGAFTTADAALDELLAMDEHLRAANFHPWPGHLFAHIAEHDATLATALAERIISSAPTSPLARLWPCLIPPATRGQPALSALLEKAAAASDSEASCAAIDYIVGSRRSEMQPVPEERRLALAMASRAGPSELGVFLRLLAIGLPEDHDFAWEIVARLPVNRYPDESLDAVLNAVPELCRDIEAARESVGTLLSKLVRVREFDLDDRPEAAGLLLREYTQEMLRFLRARVEFQLSGDAPEKYEAMTFHRGIWLDAAKLSASPGFSDLREELWKKVAVHDEHSWLWLKLFQSFGLDDTSWLMPRLDREIESARDVEHLRWITKFISFHGSLIALRQPGLTRNFLEKAAQLGGDEGSRSIRAALYCATGPRMWGWTNGNMNSEDDYLEAEALKAAEQHAEDPVLYPFFRWIVECEQEKKRRIQAEHEVREREHE